MPTDYQFTGQKKDTGTGLYYYGARYYDPVTGRFVSADTIVPSSGNPQSLNRYSYVYNNPVKYTDPTGHMVGCGAGDDTCGYSDPPVNYSPATRQYLLHDLGIHLQDIQTNEGLDPLAAFMTLTHLAARLNGSSTDDFVSDPGCVFVGYCKGPAWQVYRVGQGDQSAIVNGLFLGQGAFPGQGS